MIASRIVVALSVVALGLPETALARAQEPVAPIPASTASPAPVVSASAAAEATVTTAPASAATSPAATVIVAPSAPVPAPRIAPTPPSRSSEIKDATSIIVAGATVAGTFYFFTSLAGAVVIDKARRSDVVGTGKTTIDTRRLNYGRSLLVPVAGPFIAMRFSHSATERWALALTGVAQTAGVVLALVGASRRARARRAERLGFAPGFVAGGATVGVQGRF